MPHMHEYRAIFKCQGCNWDNDQTVEEPDEPPPAEKKIEIDCWHCGHHNVDIVVKLEG